MGTQIKDTVCVGTFPTRMKAEVARSVLTARHISSFVSGDDAGGVYPPLTAGISVFVRSEDRVKAMEVLHI